MSKFIDAFGLRTNWVFNPNRRIVKGSNLAEQQDAQDSRDSERDKSEDNPSQDESGYKRVNKAKYKCPQEPFKETLQLIEELWGHKV